MTYHEEDIEIEFPQIECVYTHMLWHDCHSIVAGEGHANVIIEQLKNPIIFILFFAAIFSIITQSKADAIFIFVVIGINTIIGTYQEWSSEKSAEKLQNMIKIRTKVLRDGKVEEIDSENIVVGDIIELESGNKVPADLRLIDVKNLSIDESILTRRNKS